MKKQELINMIRTAVRQELKESLPGILHEVSVGVASVTKNPSPKSDPVELTRAVLSSGANKSTPPKPKVKYSKNAALNEALNATVGGVPQEGSLVSGHEATPETPTDFQGNEVDMTNLPDHVSTALTRDYSALLSAVDAKQGKK